MQSSHRKRHRILWLILVPIIAVAIFYSLRSRPEFPTERIPATDR